MNAQHTPGPWFSNGTEIRKSFLNEADGSYVVALVRVGGAVWRESEHLANGRLMASSPKMLALLEQAKYGSFDSSPIAHMNWLAEVEAVIAEVHGSAS